MGFNSGFKGLVISCVGSVFPGGENYTDISQGNVLIEYCALPGANAPSCQFPVGSK